VVVGEHWRDGDGHDLVLFWEGPPAPRADSWFA
jgi:hypothetical protein